MINHQPDEEIKIMEDNDINVADDTINVQEYDEDRTMADNEMDVAPK